MKQYLLLVLGIVVCAGILFTGCREKDDEEKSGETKEITLEDLAQRIVGKWDMQYYRATGEEDTVVTEDYARAEKDIPTAKAGGYTVIIKKTSANANEQPTFFAFKVEDNQKRFFILTQGDWKRSEAVTDGKVFDYSIVYTIARQDGKYEMTYDYSSEGKLQVFYKKKRNRDEDEGEKTKFVVGTRK